MKRSRRKSIMVAVQALDRSSGALLRKAATLARQRRCELDLVHVIALPYTPAVSRRKYLHLAAQEMVRDFEQRLEKLATGPDVRGVRARAIVSWDYPAAEGVVRQVLKRRPVLLLAESHRHARLARPFLTNTDWDLIRNCPCPVWLSKRPGAETRGPVVAALDPLHANAKPSSLDDTILEQALSVAGRPARVLAAHAYMPLAPAVPPIVPGAIEAYWVAMDGQEIEQHREVVIAQVQKLCQKHGIPTANRLVEPGDPAYVLPKIVRKHRAALVVMGAVSRSAMSRLFIGHTAERVLDRLGCDVLVVKPRGFKSAVARRAPRMSSLPPL